MDVTKRKRSDTSASAKSPVTTQIKKFRQGEHSDSGDDSGDDSDARSAMENLEGCVADAQDAWETDSLLEDALQQQTEDCVGSKDFIPCTPEESLRLRRDLQRLGPAMFCQRTVDSGRYTAKKLITAFGVSPPAFLEGEPDYAYYSVLSLVMTRELAKRAKLMQYNTVDDAVDLIAKSKNIMVVTGAGISTSLGIPDFRSKGTGLYSRLEHLGLSDPQEVFDISMFREDPSIFYSVAKDILPATTRFTPTHKFISMLHDRGKLLTNYSQNIDNLEIAAGIPKDKLVQCHGSFGTASCIDCKYQVPGETIHPDIRAGVIPKCPRCAAPAAKKPAAKRKAKKSKWSDDTSDESEEEISKDGLMKPDITFFGEELPDEFGRRLTEHDRDKVDLVIIIGTSLKVTPVSEIVNFLPPEIPQLYISREAITHTRFDINLLGDCDVVVAELCRRLGWPLVHDMVPKDQVVTVRLQEGYVSRHVFEVKKGEVSKGEAKEEEDKENA